MHDLCKTCVKEAGCLDKNDPEDSCGWYQKVESAPDGGSAFPVPNSDLAGSYPPDPGMTLRDWFAGMAMQGILSSLPAEAEYNPRVTAQSAFVHADQMLMERAPK